MPLRTLKNPRRWPALLRSPKTGYVLAIISIGAVTALCTMLRPVDNPTIVSLLLLSIIMWFAFWYGRGPAVVAALVGSITFAWIFVQPRYVLTFTDSVEWLALGTFLGTSFLISQLASNARSSAKEARDREHEAAAMARVAWAVAGQMSHRDALTEVLKHLTEVTGASCAVIMRRDQKNAWELAGFYGDSYNESTWASDWPLLAKELAQNSVISSTTNAATVVRDTLCLQLLLNQQNLGTLCIKLHEKKQSFAAHSRVIEALSHQASVVLQRERLVHAETQMRVLAETDRLKTALLSMMSHDFRSPLTSIKTSVTSLMQKDTRHWESGQQQRLLTAIDQETDRLNRMVGNILSLSQLESGHWRPQCEQTMLTEILELTIGSFSGDDSRRIVVNLENAPEEAWLDIVQIVQVLYNLLENALKYSPSSQNVYLHVTQEQNDLVFEIIDSGVGLSDTDEARLFERLYRAPRWRESSVSGTGIGLTICDALVEAHDGTLAAFNRPEGGSRFRVALPLRPSTLDPGKVLKVHYEDSGH